MENSKRSYTLDWVIVEGGTQPGVDLSNRDALIDLMEEDPTTGRAATVGRNSRATR